LKEILSYPITEHLHQDVVGQIFSTILDTWKNIHRVGPRRPADVYLSDVNVTSPM